MRFSVSTRGREVSFAVARRLFALELVQGAAHVLSDRATAFIEETKTRWKLTLCAKSPSDAVELRTLGLEFVDELHNQALRQRLIANARPVFEHIVARAVVSAVQPERKPPEELGPEQKAELERLIAEAEAELAARPRPAARTWEERYGRPRTG